MKERILKPFLLVGLLMSCFSISSHYYFNFVSGATDIYDPPGVLGDWKWDFDEGDLIMFNVIYSQKIGEMNLIQKILLIYNISSIANKIIPYGQNYNCSCINITFLEYNYQLDKLEPTSSVITSLAFNHTATPSLNEKFFIFGGFSSILPLQFIPKNDTNIDVEWAGKVAFEYYQSAGYFDSYSANAITKSLNFSSSAYGWTYNATYFNNGTLAKYSEYNPMGGVENTIYMERTWDYNLLDDLSWGVASGDVLYFGNDLNEYKFDIVGFNNTMMIIMPYYTPRPYQQVLANVSVWNNDTETYIPTEINRTIGLANEIDKVIYYYYGLGLAYTPLLYPLGTNGTDFSTSYIYGSYVNSMYYDQVEKGENIYRLWNSTNDNIWNITLTSDKILKSMFQKIKASSGQNDQYEQIFKKNETILSSGVKNIDLEPVGTFNLTIDLTLTDDIAFYWATLPFTPTRNITVENGLFYFDLYCNNSAAISGKITVTVELDISLFTARGMLESDIKLWRFKNDSETYSYEAIPFTLNIASGKLTAQLDHFSYYGIGGPATQPPSNPSIKINNDEATTNKTLVIVTISCDGAGEMCFRNGTTGTWTDWEPYNATKQLYLPSSTNNTDYEICVKFRNAAGESTVTSDTIKFLNLTNPNDEEEPPFVIPGYPLEMLVILLIGTVGIISISVKFKKIKLRFKL